MSKIIKSLLPFVLTVLFVLALMTSTLPRIVGNLKLGLDLQGGFDILYQVKPIDSEQQVTKPQLLATERMIEKRVNITKVSEPELTIEGADRIRVRIAGDGDQTKLRELIGRPAFLRIADEQDRVVLDGGDLLPNGADTGYDALNRPEVIVKFKDPAKLKRVTQDNLGKTLTFMMDDNVVSEAVVQAVVRDGVSAITSGDQDASTELKDLLNAGSLPARLIELQVDTISPGLGEEALQHTLLAGGIAAAAILAFMAAVYRLAGLAANLTIACFAYIGLVALDWMNASMTLSGIAGFVLAIGMAVDANIITYEKIREELREGKSLRSACRVGARASMATIVDAHVTTLIAALILMMFGDGSVKGFAVVLTMTIVVSLLTNVYGSRLFLRLLLRGDVFRSAGWFGVRMAGNADQTARLPNLVKRRKRYLSFSALILVLGLAAILVRGLELGVDFKSGTRLELAIGVPFEAADVTTAIREVVPSVDMRPVIKSGHGSISSAVTTFGSTLSPSQLDSIEDKLRQLYGKQVTGQESTVDPVIAGETVKKAGYAVLMAAGAIVLYTALRFHYLYGIGCIVALAHDIFIPIALFSVFGLEIDLTFIAAILTIIGYSLNDTIVIFDRIRSKMRKERPTTTEQLEQLVNASLRQTLRRSVFTVLTVFIAALALFVMGGEGIRLFSLALLFGLACGTYSSIFIAAQIWMMLYKRIRLRSQASRK
ncbi:protein translocase subunit SecF [Paenibacillus glycinis]|uniref:Multifunctional fusion protein n=1 Tax=Paenibacillus glycinis TaxID=2697035 RepID=A0ABW9XRK9_9BACL|nr:protein translocase subunit SecF [Paenibacillus glycinis]NBD25016.1 protein translocase subunit SecF [Paenibacillus glycinis]